MAPSATTTATETASQPQEFRLESTYKEFQTYHYEDDAEKGKKDGFEAAKYPHYLPTWDKSTKYPPLEPFEHYEHGKDADSTFPDLLPEGTQVNHLTPTIGTEVHGIQLSSLNDAGKDQLARFVAERKVVAFRKQDFKDLSIEDALKFGGYFGRHHIHPTSGAPKGHPEIHLVHRGAGDTFSDQFFADRVSSVAWHSDVSYEQQPPGTTFLYILDTPEVGGDTLFCNAVEAYNRLSPLFQERLHGLKAVHSGVEQVAVAHSRGSINRREPVTNVHPIVRTHPITGEKGYSSYSLHCWLEERRERGYPQILISAHRCGCRFPHKGEVGGRHCSGMGQPRYAALGTVRLEERTTTTPSAYHTSG